MGDLGAVLGGLGAVLGDLGAILGGLGMVLGDLGAILGGLGAILGRLGTTLGGLGAVLGGSWSLQGRSKIGQKIDPKIDPKSSRIWIAQKRSGATPADVSALYRRHREPDAGALFCYVNRYRYD